MPVGLVDSHVQVPRAGAEQVRSVVAAVCSECLCEVAGAGGQEPVGDGRGSACHAALPGEVCAFEDFAGADEHPCAASRTVGHDVDREVHPVDEIAVQVPTGAEHGRIALCSAAKSVRTGVRAADVGFDLGDAQCNGSVGTRVDENSAKKIRGEGKGRAEEEAFLRPGSVCVDQCFSS